MERRLYDRMGLKESISCNCQIGDAPPVPAFILNLSMMGAQVEIPGFDAELEAECCQRVVITGRGESCEVCQGMVGTSAWLYKSFIGVRFDHPIKPSGQELRDWLEDLGYG